jgi:hypothetical protein
MCFIERLFDVFLAPDSYNLLAALNDEDALLVPNVHTRIAKIRFPSHAVQSLPLPHHTSSHHHGPTSTAVACSIVNSMEIV